MHVLVVDDNLVTLEATGELLRLSGYSVDMAQNGLSALTLLQARRPDLILLDLVMPGLGGRELLERIEAMGLSVPVVVLSAVSAGELAELSQKHPAITVLHKPIASADLLAAVASAVS